MLNEEVARDTAGERSRLVRLTFGDTILDRRVNNAHRIALAGGFMRTLYASTRPDCPHPSDEKDVR